MMRLKSVTNFLSTTSSKSSPIGLIYSEWGYRGLFQKLKCISCLARGIAAATSSTLRFIVCIVSCSRDWGHFNRRFSLRYLGTVVLTRRRATAANDIMASNLGSNWQAPSWTSGTYLYSSVPKISACKVNMKTHTLFHTNYLSLQSAAFGGASLQSLALGSIVFFELPFLDIRVRKIEVHNCFL